MTKNNTLTATVNFCGNSCCDRPANSLDLGKKEHTSVIVALRVPKRIATQLHVHDYQLARRIAIEAWSPDENSLQLEQNNMVAKAAIAAKELARLETEPYPSPVNGYSYVYDPYEYGYGFGGGLTSLGLPATPETADWSKFDPKRAQKQLLESERKGTSSKVGFSWHYDYAGNARPEPLINGLYQYVEMCYPEAVHPDEMHITLIHLADDYHKLDKLTAATPEATTVKEKLLRKLFEFVKQNGTNLYSVKAKISGVGRFMKLKRPSNSNDYLNLDPSIKDAVYASLDAPEIIQLRNDIYEHIKSVQGVKQPEKQEYGFTPHITLGYIPSLASELHPQIHENIPVGQNISFNGIELWWGEERISIPFQRPYNGLGRFSASSDGTDKDNSDSDSLGSVIAHFSRNPERKQGRFRKPNFNLGSSDTVGFVAVENPDEYTYGKGAAQNNDNQSKKPSESGGPVVIKGDLVRDANGQYSAKDGAESGKEKPNPNWAQKERDKKKAESESDAIVRSQENLSKLLGADIAEILSQYTDDELINLPKEMIDKLIKMGLLKSADLDEKGSGKVRLSFTDKGAELIIASKSLDPKDKETHGKLKAILDGKKPETDKLEKKSDKDKELEKEKSGSGTGTKAGAGTPSPKPNPTPNPQGSQIKGTAPIQPISKAGTNSGGGSNKGSSGSSGGGSDSGSKGDSKNKDDKDKEKKGVGGGGGGGGGSKEPKEPKPEKAPKQTPEEQLLEFKGNATKLLGDMVSPKALGAMLEGRDVKEVGSLLNVPDGDEAGEELIKSGLAVKIPPSSGGGYKLNGFGNKLLRQALTSTENATDVLKKDLKSLSGKAKKAYDESERKKAEKTEADERREQELDDDSDKRLAPVKQGARMLLKDVLSEDVLNSVLKGRIGNFRKVKQGSAEAKALEDSNIATYDPVLKKYKMTPAGKSLFELSLISQDNFKDPQYYNLMRQKVQDFAKQVKVNKLSTYENTDVDTRTTGINFFASDSDSDDVIEPSLNLAEFIGGNLSDRTGTEKKKIRYSQIYVKFDGSSQGSYDYGKNAAQNDANQSKRPVVSGEPVVIKGNLARDITGQYIRLGSGQGSSDPSKASDDDVANSKTLQRKKKRQALKDKIQERINGGGMDDDGKTELGNITEDENMETLLNVADVMEKVLGQEFAEIFTVGDTPFDIKGVKPSHGDQLVAMGIANKIPKDEGGGYELNKAGQEIVGAAMRDGDAPENERYIRRQLAVAKKEKQEADALRAKRAEAAQKFGGRLNDYSDSLLASKGSTGSSKGNTNGSGGSKKAGTGSGGGQSQQQQQQQQQQKKKGDGLSGIRQAWKELKERQNKNTQSGAKKVADSIVGKNQS
jgi:2'-5' RNA ligase superfamily